MLAEGVTLNPASEVTMLKAKVPKSKIQIEDYWNRRRNDQEKLVGQHDKIVQKRRFHR